MVPAKSKCRIETISSDSRLFAGPGPPQKYRTTAAPIVKRCQAALLRSAQQILGFLVAFSASKRNSIPKRAYFDIGIDGVESCGIVFGLFRPPDC
jgi:hypothetical protein